MQKQNETAQQKLCTGRHQYREWNLTQSEEAQTMFIKCFWNILWWVIEVVNCIKSTEHKSDSFQAPISPFPHYNSMQASLRLPSIWLINSTLWTRVTCMIHLLCFLHQISSQLLLPYTCLISFADTRCLWKPAATRLLNPNGVAPCWSSLPSPCAAPMVW